MTYTQGLIVTVVVLLAASKFEVVDTFGFFALLALLVIDVWSDDRPITRAKR